MPIEIISTTQTATYDVTNNDDVFVAAGAGVTSMNEAILASSTGSISNISVTVQGTLYGTAGIDLFSNPSGANATYILVADGGFVYGTNDAVAIRQGADNVVVNYGTISSQQHAILFGGGQATISNHGTISSFGEVNQNAILFNSLTGGNNVREVINTGIISGAGDSTFNANATIYNSGGAEFHLNNSGTISGEEATALYSTALENFVDNSGLIIGDINMIRYVEFGNSGRIVGDVTLSFENDVYLGSGDGVITGVLDLGGGSDTATLGNAGGQVVGGAGDDTVTGGTGDDIVNGGSNNDVIRGGIGDDIIEGGEGNDTLRGGQGDDELFGDAGDDFIRGGSGDDIVDGGIGSDTVFGNAGADTFVFDDISDSTNDAGRDLIQDFESGVDVIDLSAFGASFTFIGDDAFTGTGAEIRVTTPATGKTKIFVDVDGDGTADMRIILSGQPTFVVDDFLF